MPDVSPQDVLSKNAQNAKDISVARGMTPMPGDLFLNPKIAPDVGKAAARPFAPGEWVQNPDGSWSSEITVTVTDPSINDGKPTVLPSLWLVDGKPYRVNEDNAIKYAKESGLNFQSFDDMDAAEKFADERESKWQNLAPIDAGSVEPLWSMPKMEAK